jgi:hypothetical protein
MYSTYLSDERRRDRENPPRPFGLRRKSGHTFVVALDLGLARAFGLRRVWPDFRATLSAL